MKVTMNGLFVRGRLWLAEDQVKDLLFWSQRGPTTARVDKVDTRWRSYTGEFADFRIMNE
jgi:acylphosphatase